MAKPNMLPSFMAWLEQLVCPIACSPTEPEEVRRRKLQFTAFSIFVIPAGAIWGALYFVNGERTTAIIPTAYSALTLLDFLLFLKLKHYELYRRTQQLLILLLPVSLHIALGGYVGSSAVIIWSFLGVLSGVLFGSAREALWWFAAYIFDLILVAVLQPGITIPNHLSHTLIVVFYVLNLVTVSGISFLVLYSFIQDRRRLRELELKYLNQEMALRQSEKLATLGTLAAGLAHELNNPAAATRRAAQQLKEVIQAQNDARATLDSLRPTEEELQFLSTFSDTYLNFERAMLSAIEQSD